MDSDTSLLPALKRHLADLGIETQIHHPTALPLMARYARLGAREADVPRAARAQSEILSFPIYPEMTEIMLEHVVTSIRRFYPNKRVVRGRLVTATTEPASE